ncbi:MAG: rhomboid family intramembrane serine protease [Candidatus Kapaibacterium sp.]
MRMFPPVIKWLLGINVALFLIGFIPVGHDGLTVNTFLQAYGMLWPIGTHFRPWQFLTHLFLHADISHIFFNMLVLWMFGMELEQMWGSRRFAAYYFLCGLGAGLAQLLVSFLLKDTSPALGASGAIMGVVIAFGLAYPNRTILMGFFFPLPAKYAMLVMVGIDLYMGISRGDHVAHFAHLGGALMGFILVKTGGVLTLGGIFDRFPWFTMGSVPRIQTFATPPQQRQPAARVMDVQYRDVQPRRDAPITMKFSNQEQIDAILDKISHSGYQNLTEEEKSIIAEAGKKLR